MLQQDHEHHELKSPYCSFILSGVPGGCQKSKHSPTVPRSLLQNPEAEGKHLFLPKRGGGSDVVVWRKRKGDPSFEQLKFISLRSLLGILDDFQRLQMNPNSPSVEGYSGLNRLNSLDQTRPLGVILVNQPCVSPWLRFLSSPWEFPNFPAIWRWDS